MNSKRLSATIFICILIGLLISTSAINKAQITTLNMVYINEIHKIVEAHWVNLSEANYPDKIYNFEIIRLEQEDYESRLNQSMKQFATVVDIHQGSQIVGKLIFNTNLEKQFLKVKQQLIQNLFVAYAILITIICIYFIYFKRRIFQPFARLKVFASSIASGNLDNPLEMDCNNIFGAFSESFDIMREALKTAKHNEYLANLSKKELVASLSHDIKTPVASIKAITELMLVKPQDEKTSHHLQMIQDKSEQINQLITDMFQATLEELNELKVTISEQSSVILTELIKQADYQGRVHIGKIPECMICIDILRFQQVLDNVVNNCYKYADTPIDITFNLISNYLEMDIHDYGKGVEQEELQLIFNKFYRGKNGKGQNGAGLGLYLSQYLMKKQEGDINGFNTEDGFTIKLLIKLV